jgi:toxin ParE1/3/4
VKGHEHSIRLLRIAEEDLGDIIAYIAEDRPSAAEALAIKIEKNLILLSKNPHLGRIPKEEGLAGMGFRYLVVEDYLFFYKIEGTTILVYRIIHGARDYQGLF